MRLKICLQSFPDTHSPVVLSTMFDTILQAKTKLQGHTTYHTHTPACLYAALQRPIYFVLFTHPHTHAQRGETSKLRRGFVSLMNLQWDSVESPFYMHACNKHHLPLLLFIVLDLIQVIRSWLHPTAFHHVSQHWHQLLDRSLPSLRKKMSTSPLTESGSICLAHSLLHPSLPKRAPFAHCPRNQKK